MPLYAGSGLSEQRGEGAGASLNLPLPAGAGDQPMLQALHRRLDPLLEKFRPPPPPWLTWGRCWPARSQALDGGARLRWGLINKVDGWLADGLHLNRARKNGGTEALAACPDEDLSIVAFCSHIDYFLVPT
jgi:hypothetical protein